jgi:hypothetical protein
LFTVIVLCLNTDINVRVAPGILSNGTLESNERFHIESCVAVVSKPLGDDQQTGNAKGDYAKFSHINVTYSLVIYGVNFGSPYRHIN